MLAVNPCMKFRVPTGPDSPAAKSPPPARRHGRGAKMMFRSVRVTA